MSGGNLSKLEAELLRAALTAHTVQRPPNGVLKFGDTAVVVYRRTGSLVTIKTVGTKWITVSGFPRLQFDKNTRYGGYPGMGRDHVLKTVEQHEYDQRLDTARDDLRGTGLEVSYMAPPPDGWIFAFASLVELLKESEAAQTT